MSRKVLFRSPASHWQPWISKHDLEKGDTVSPINEEVASPTLTQDSNGNSNTNSGTATPSHHFGYHGHHGRRLRQFIRPNGRKVHICHTPEEHEHVKKRLLETQPDHDFDIFIHGTPEHLEAIRELHSHHENRRNSLREKHGEIYDQFENVKSELDLLSEELHNLTEHGVALDANFSKFGYSAHLRTKDDDDDAASHDDHSGIKHHQDRKAEALKFFKRPVIRQYFHKGLLWRSAKSSEVGSFELFVDLLYVGIIGIIGDKAVSDPTGKSILEYSITFLIGWKIWADLTLIINWFEMDDIFGRMAVLLYLACLFGFTVNVSYAFDTTYTVMVAFYLAERLYAGCYFFLCSFALPTVKGTLIYHVFLILLSSALWIGSVHMSYPHYLPLICIALALDMFGWLMLLWIMRGVNRSESKFYHKYFDFWPAINIEHRTERNNAFVSLVFGYSVLTILYQNRSSIGINAFFGKGILGLLQAFTFNWIYFEIDHYNLHVHAIRRHWFSSSIWMSAQVPFIMGYVLAAATLSQLVLAHDCGDANLDTLGEDYVSRSPASISRGVRWYYCGGLGVALICMSLISLSHIHKRLPNPRLMKRPRLFIRCCVAVIITCLPLAHDRLSSLDLIATTTSLTVFVLVIDLFGNSCAGDQFWTGGFRSEQKNACKYSARCHVSKRKKKQIVEAMKRGEKVDLEDVLRRSGTSNSSRTSLSLGDDVLGDDIWAGGHV